MAERQPLNAAEIAAWFRRCADGVETKLEAAVIPGDFEGSYVGPVVGLCIALAEFFPGDKMTLSEWDAIDKRMREILEEKT